MSETPIVQIDLSQDNSWDQVDDTLLTQEDKALLKEHFNEEHEGIIYLTHQEIQELKQTIDATQDPRREAGGRQVLGESFNDFIQEQKTEGFSLSDMLGEDSEHAELMTELESQAKEHLFKSDGVFGNLDISDTAQNHMSSALLLGILKHLGESETISIDVLTKPADFFTGIVEKFGELKTLADTMISGGPGGEHHKLQISGMGEQNSIFMDPKIGGDFIAKVLKGDMSADDMESELEEANTQEPINIDIAGLQIEAGEGIQAVETKIKETLANMTPEEQAEVAANLAEDGEEENWLVKLIKALFSGIIEVGESFGIVDKTGDNAEKKVLELSEEEKEENTQLIEMLGELPENKEFVKKLKGDPSSTQRILNMLESISPDETWQETFQDVLGNQKGENIKTLFESHGFDLQFKGKGFNETQKTIKLLEEYSRYRNSDGVAGLTKGRTPWEDWAQKRQGENWKVGGR